MRNIILNVLALGSISLLTAQQVGIGTTTPKADLEIVANTGIAAGMFNGVVIPKIASLPAIAGPSGLVVYLTTQDGTNAPGLYFSNGTNYINVTDAIPGLVVLPGGANDAVISNQAPAANTVVLNGGEGISITESGNTISVSNTLKPIATIPMYTQHDAIGYMINATSGVDIPLSNAGLEPTLFNPAGNIEVKMIVRYRNNNAAFSNFTLRATTSTQDDFPIVETGWTYSTVFNHGNSETEVIATSPWRVFNAGTNARDIKLHAWVSNNNIQLRNVYLMVRSL